VEKEVELEEKEAEYIWQLNEKVINVEKFRELIGDGRECCGGSSYDAGRGDWGE
jgi:hypothetical protein